MPSRKNRDNKIRAASGAIVLAVLIAAWPMRDARAYIDPNSAGPLYQMLFPLFIAITSLLAAFRSMIRRTWNRLMNVISITVRGGGGKPVSQDSADPPL
jgi:hypothetical protein